MAYNPITLKCDECQESFIVFPRSIRNGYLVANFLIDGPKFEYDSTTSKYFYNGVKSHLCLCDKCATHQAVAAGLDLIFKQEI
jgi:hypothetical protein